MITLDNAVKMIFPVYSVKGARAIKGVSFAFSVSQLFISSHNSSEVQVVPDYIIWNLFTRFNYL